MSPDEFIDLIEKVMEGLSELAKQQGIKAMRVAAFISSKAAVNGLDWHDSQAY